VLLFAGPRHNDETAAIIRNRMPDAFNWFVLPPAEIEARASAGNTERRRAKGIGLWQAESQVANDRRRPLPREQAG
jgi:hypothetical protein